MSSLTSMLANAYDSAISAINTDGDAAPGARWFAAWLADHWSHNHTAPSQEPDAVSLDPNGSMRMRWYALGGVILGFANADSRGCYVVTVEEITRLASLLTST